MALRSRATTLLTITATSTTLQVWKNPIPHKTHDSNSTNTSSPKPYSTPTTPAQFQQTMKKKTEREHECSTYRLVQLANEISPTMTELLRMTNQLWSKHETTDRTVLEQRHRLSALQTDLAGHRQQRSAACTATRSSRKSISSCKRPPLVRRPPRAAARLQDGLAELVGNLKIKASTRSRSPRSSRPATCRRRRWTTGSGGARRTRRGGWITIRSGVPR